MEDIWWYEIHCPNCGVLKRIKGARVCPDCGEEQVICLPPVRLGEDIDETD